jgi:hypothetical protein
MQRDFPFLKILREDICLWVKDARTEFTVHIPIRVAALVSFPFLNLLSTKGLFLDSVYLLIVKGELEQGLRSMN